jgi:hypothetical protein
MLYIWQSPAMTSSGKQVFFMVLSMVQSSKIPFVHRNTIAKKLVQQWYQI